MKRIIGKICVCVLVFLLTSCEKEIDFKYNEIDPILVIEGALTQNGAEVSLTLTTPMSQPMDRQYLRDASVRLLDMETGDETVLLADETGLFVSDTPGVPGHRYKLHVEREGKNYTAECLMRPEPELTGMEFSWIKMPYDYVAVLQVSWKDDPEVMYDCYWLRLTRNGEAYKWAEVSDMLSTGGVINQIMMTTRRDLEEEDEGDKLEKGDVIRATVVATSREMYDYLQALSAGNSNGSRMFEGDFCLGYFLAGGVSERTMIFDPEGF